MAGAEEHETHKHKEQPKENSDKGVKIQIEDSNDHGFEKY